MEHSQTNFNGAGPKGKKKQRIGQYFIEKTIGKGNFAVVKLATHVITNTKVCFICLLLSLLLFISFRLLFSSPAEFIRLIKEDRFFSNSLF